MLPHQSNDSQSEGIQLLPAEISDDSLVDEDIDMFSDDSLDQDIQAFTDSSEIDDGDLMGFDVISNPVEEVENESSVANSYEEIVEFSDEDVIQSEGREIRNPSQDELREEVYENSHNEVDVAADISHDSALNPAVSDDVAANISNDSSPNPVESEISDLSDLSNLSPPHQLADNRDVVMDLAHELSDVLGMSPGELDSIDQNPEESRVRIVLR